MIDVEMRDAHNKRVFEAADFLRRNNYELLDASYVHPLPRNTHVVPLFNNRLSDIGSHIDTSGLIRSFGVGLLEKMNNSTLLGLISGKAERLTYLADFSWTYSSSLPSLDSWNVRVFGKQNLDLIEDLTTKMDLGLDYNIRLMTERPLILQGKRNGYIQRV